MLAHCFGRYYYEYSKKLTAASCSWRAIISSAAATSTIPSTEAFVAVSFVRHGLYRSIGVGDAILRLYLKWQ